MQAPARIILTASVTMMSTMTYAQSFVDARTLGLGAASVAVRDARDFLANPAGLLGVRDWELNGSTYMNTSTATNGFVFHGLSLGKKLGDRAALGFQYAPGSALTFLLPPVVSLDASESNEQEVKYAESFGGGAAARLPWGLDLGLSTRYRTENVSTTTYRIVIEDTVAYPVAVRETSEGTSWFLDGGLLWTPVPSWTISVVGRNLLKIIPGRLEGDAASYRLPTRAYAEGGVSYAPGSRLRFALTANSTAAGAAGWEWTPLQELTVRNGWFLNTRESPAVCAVSAGLGLRYEFVEVAAAYIHFFDREAHGGTGTVATFDPSDIYDLNLNPYTLDRLTLSAKAIFGNVRESLVRIEGVSVTSAVYPAASETFAFNPIGTVRVKNISRQPVQARASLFVERIMDQPTESHAVHILPGEVAEIPLTAVFNEQVRRVTSLTVREGDVYVTAKPAERYDDRVQARLVIHGRNDWDGNVLSLRYFVTPDDPAVLRYSRDLLLQRKDSLAGVSSALEDLTKARMLINGFAGQLLYVGDPKKSADHVQYPSETLQTRGGDCDDLTVCFASLLSSIGISTAFVDVVPPDRPAESHIYLLFDTGIEPRFGAYVSDNPKRYVVRTTKLGKETIWIPLETTVINAGFDQAWTSGAQKYFDDVEVELGLVKGWVRIVDVN